MEMSDSFILFLDKKLLSTENDLYGSILVAGIPLSICSNIEKS